MESRMRRSSLACLIIPLLADAAPAWAGDAATLEILGFTGDGGVFAFEEFGVQDGSGFPYAHRFYIDTASDSFLPGTPIRVRIDDETAGVDDARDQAREQGEAIVPHATLAGNRGFTAGINAVTELSADPTRMAVNPRPVFPPVDRPLEFRIEEVSVAQPPDCPADFGTVTGFRLLRIGASDGETTAILHEDTGVPASRRCPTGYAIGAVQTFFPESGDPVFAVLISVRSFGFEGPDHRWIAIPGKL